MGQSRVAFPHINPQEGSWNFLKAPTQNWNMWWISTPAPMNANLNLYHPDFLTNVSCRCMQKTMQRNLKFKSFCGKTKLILTSQTHIKTKRERENEIPWTDYNQNALTNVSWRCIQKTMQRNLKFQEFLWQEQTASYITDRQTERQTQSTKKPHTSRGQIQWYSIQLYVQFILSIMADT